MLQNNCTPVLPWNHKDISDDNSAVRNSQCGKGRGVSDPMVTVLTYSLCWRQNQVCKQPWCKASLEKYNETDQVRRNTWRMANSRVKHVPAMWKHASKLYIRVLKFTLRATLSPFTGGETEAQAQGVEFCLRSLRLTMPPQNMQGEEGKESSGRKKSLVMPLKALA